MYDDPRKVQEEKEREKALLLHFQTLVGSLANELKVYPIISLTRFEIADADGSTIEYRVKLRKV